MYCGQSFNFSKIQNHALHFYVFCILYAIPVSIVLEYLDHRPPTINVKLPNRTTQEWQLIWDRNMVRQCMTGASWYQFFRAKEIQLKWSAAIFQTYTKRYFQSCANLPLNCVADGMSKWKISLFNQDVLLKFTPVISSLCFPLLAFMFFFHSNIGVYDINYEVFSNCQPKKLFN